MLRPTFITCVKQPSDLCSIASRELKMRCMEPELFQALIDLTRTLAGGSDFEGFCAAIANVLRRIVCVSSVRLFFQDPAGNQLRLIASSCEPGSAVDESQNEL